MARRAREISSTGKYAVVLKGVDEIFSQEDMRTAFDETAAVYLGKGLLAIRFFDDRAEMLIKESEKGISKDMKPLVTSFARTYNRVKESAGKVFADRFKSVPVETDELERECLEYLNGGGNESPFKRGAGAAAAPAKRKAEQKQETAPERETAPKPKKTKNLPSWLL